MKKTMFITSVIMVVVMAIALTTSSLAWFTATGASSVTTTSLKLQAKANASTGVQISAVSATESWGIEASLNGYASTSGTTKIDDNSLTGQSDAQGLMPLLPLMDSSTFLASDSAADLMALAVEALGKNSTSSFIGNTISTVTFDGTPYETGYFVDEIWITNTASGSGAAEISITPSIAFYETGTTTAYDAESTDPVLYVAVLGVDDVDTTTEDYEIVQIFNSKGLTTINLGKTAALFADEATVASSYVSGVAISKLLANSGKTSFNLPVAEDGAAFGEARQFKIVAWYDATTLNNNNSGFAVDFVLTFSASTPNA